jgi:galactoside 2-L-fucosyltransferase 1/2
MIKAQSVEKSLRIVFPEKIKEFEQFPGIKYDIDNTSKFMILPENKFEYDQQIVDTVSNDNNIKLSGYFQSYKYFDKYRDLIVDCMQIDDLYLQKAKRVYVSLTRGNKLCGVHIRLPDTRGQSGFVYSTPSNKFIQDAVSKVKGVCVNVRFIVCSNDMSECKRLYSGFFPEDTIFSEMDSFTDFAMLCITDYNIITTGTFGWWASYLNKSVDKLIVCLSPNFNPEVPRVSVNNETDYYPPDWCIIKN